MKAVDGVSIGYQVFGEGPYDLVLNDGWMGNLDANWDVDDMFSRTSTAKVISCQQNLSFVIFWLIEDKFLLWISGIIETPVIKKKSAIPSFLNQFEKLFWYNLIRINIRHV